MIQNLGAHSCHLLVEDGLYKRHASTAASSGLGARLDITDALAATIFDHVDDVAFGDIMTRADLGVVVATAHQPCLF